ncbi:SPFH domain / Band 7 family protein [Tenacibaculum sp. MAR_2010_89]|uniref:SPFH domain-containing protein n=1 Tax=Tenacibaculum sp. MAR_2010_89 TaxID=1250198 RepID=UPI000897A391|nr:SPFH domain-containing protein [Tenacibaculum sp. MAR_2010_89]SEE29236.1 SPFH domain / Band 7 family protein [Tenacibaculum sp. MAR_2010_89]
MLTFLGILLIIIGLLTLILKSIIKKDGFLNWFTTNRSIQFTLLGILLSIITGMFFYAEAGTAYAVQFVSGGDKMITTQGLKLKWWGRIIPLSYETSIKDVILKDDVELPKSSQGIYNRKAQKWEFSDAIKAEISTSVIVGVNINDEKVFLNMADRNRSESKLIYGRVLPNIDAAIKNTCKLMDAQDYISGQASDFDRYFRDQLENGMYQVEQYYESENTNEIVGDTTTIRKINVGKSSKQKKFRIKRNSDGSIARDNSNTLKQYGLKIYQAQVTGIDWEESFDERLDLQKNEVAQTQLEKQQAEREYYRAKKEVAKGESEKAKERARLEKIQIQQTIEAETQAKVAGFNLIKEKKQYEVEQFKAKSKKVAADAQYYENAKLVSAGLTPQERAEWEYKTAVGVAKEIKDLKLPSTYIEGSKNGNSGNLLQSLIGAELAKKMMEKK